MNPGTGDWIFALVVVLAATLFVRLGLWQMDRRVERRAVNELRAERLEEPPLRLSLTGVDASRGTRTGTDGTTNARGNADGVRPDGLPSPDEIAWRRVEIRGHWDYAHEVVLRNRSHRGSPGVYVLTPLLIGEGGDTLAVPVLRGWLPAADATHADLSLGRSAGADPHGTTGGAVDEETTADGSAAGGAAVEETATGTVTVAGIALTGAEERGGPVDTLRSAGGRHPVVSRPHVPTLRALLPYPSADFIVQADPRSATSSLPRPVPAPELDAGPHLMYALQWFSFALIAVAGGAVFLWTRIRD